MLKSIVAVITLCLAAPALAADGPPPLEECFLVTPSITIGDKKASAGVGFVLQVGERLLLVTSHQVVGPAGGLPEQVPYETLHASFQGVVVRDAFNNNECARGDKVLAIQGKTMGDDGKADIAAFELAKSKSSLDTVKRGQGTLHPGALATAAPKKDEPVFLAAKTGGDTHMIEAKVGQVTDGFIFYEFTGTPELVGTVGGPLLNSKGEVIGIHVGMGQFEDGTVFGSANPLPAVKKALEAKAVVPAAPAP